jgi:geranylgeranylglycerol-phosphate geranylgeranyltransferase
MMGHGRRKIIAFARLSRPVNVLIACLTVIVAAQLSGGLMPLQNVIFAALSASLITIGANVINDYYDITIDRINKPHRPLAAGEISAHETLIYFGVVYLLAWLIAILISPLMFLIAFVFSLLLYLYSYRLKRTVLWGNLVVSLTTAVAFIYGGLAVNNFRAMLFPAGFAFFFHLGREILKDMQDVVGDHRGGALTFPVKHGFQAAIKLVLLDFMLLIILTIIPYILDVYSIKYFITVIVGIYPVLFYVLAEAWKNPGAARLGMLSNLLKADMVIGLLAIYVS